MPPPAPRALITASEVFPALERLAHDAEQELLLAFRIFDPATRLRAPELRRQGLDTWRDLIASLCDRGVNVRLLMADFDPVFASDLHRDAWAAADVFEKVMGTCGQVLSAPHGHVAGRIWRWAMWREVARRLGDLKREARARLTPLQNRALSGRIELRPVTLHQKFAVADGTRAIIGGMDLDERRWDTPAHDRPAEDTWHDVSVVVDGPVVATARTHFVECWNAARQSAEPEMRAATEDMALRDPQPSDRDLRFVRTLSKPLARPARLGPAHDIMEHEATLIEAFANARRHIYVETQFLRHMPLARAMARAARANGDLQLVVVLPSEPERVIFGGHTGVDARYAQALQLRCLSLLQSSFGDRLAVVCPVQPKPAAPDTPKPLQDAGIVYVHAKVTLIDDTLGLVGSANLNGRSMRWDTEASVLFRDPDAVRDLRARLAGIWLGPHAEDADTTRAHVWRQAALSNAARAPQDRQGFAMPYPFARNRRFSRHIPILPAEMF